MRKALLGVVGIASFLGVFAQSGESNVKKGTLAVQLGAYDFKTVQKIKNTSMSSVLGNKEWSGLSETDMALGLSYVKGITNNIDYSVNGYLGSVKYPFRRGDGTTDFRRVDKLLAEIDASLHVKLLPDNFLAVPYLSAGLGVSSWDGRFEGFAPLGAGMQFNLGSGYFLFSNFQYRVPVTQGANYHFFYSIGVGGSVGKEKEPEVKPVPVAPVAPPPPPADTDKDGIIDAEDKCPTVAGVAKYQGCPVPDTDKDGINDEQDKCPTVAGVAKYQGCPVPDTDKDGINDEQDKCPSVAGLPRYQGCPIPDSDGDGVNDEEDKCPAVPGVAELRGCPRPSFKAENVLFATGSSTMLATGKAEVNKLVAFLNENSGVKITVAGHTDNTGNAAINQKLSELRAAAVKKYIVSKGVDAARITAVGFGSEKPVADNKSADGRKKNRRVEFTVDE